MDKPTRILIADDHFVVRQGIKQVLLEHYPKAKFGEAPDGNEAMRLVWTEEWDVVVLDISMPGRGGLDALKDIKHAKPKLPVIVISMHPEDQFAVRVLKLGAVAYIRKDSVGQELVKGVGAALSGTRYITGTVADLLASHVTEDHSKAIHEALSDREYQVMCLLSNGKTVKEIAGDLSLSVKTISTYRTRILEKMGLKNNSQIMRYAVSQGLVDVSDAV